MQLVLVLPGLLEQRGSGAALAPAPALAQLLALAGPPTRNPDGLEAAIATHYGVERQADWPLAPIRAAALGLRVEGAYWLAADPVTLVVGRDEVAFSGIVDDLTQADADALVARLNIHFAADGVAFVAPRPDAMFARLASPPRLATHPPAATPGQPLRTRLPEGPDAPTWRRWQSEIQMLLHEHPVNVEREKKGLSPVNGLWIWSGGVLPPRPAAPPSLRTFAHNGVAVALAVHAGAPAQALPSDLSHALDDSGGVELALVALGKSVDLIDLERAWAVPARDALVTGRLSAVSILARDAGDAITWRATRPGLWQRVAGRVRRYEFAAEIAGVRE